MALSVFDDKSKQPQAADLAAALGKTLVHWNKLKDILASRFSVTEEWGYTSKSTGWGMRLKTEKRVVVYMTPREGYFLASFALGEKAVAAARESGLPDSVLEIIDSAKKYAEGRGVRIEVRNSKDVRNVEKLAVAKMAN